MTEAIDGRMMILRWKVGLQDAQRAMGLIRQRAAEWHVDDDAIGAIGFSAGGEINVMLSVYWNEPRQYPSIDAADTLSSRPDFNIRLYGGGFTNNGTNALREDIASRINQSTPPMFISHAFDEDIANPDAVAISLRRDGELLHATTGAEVKDGQARNLMAVINQIIEQGRVIHRGDIIICGALGGAKPGEKGSYAADFGKLGVINFKLE